MDFSSPVYLELLRTAESDRRMARLPVCADCGRPIVTEQCLPIEEDGFRAYLCEGCVVRRLVPVEDVS